MNFFDTYNILIKGSCSGYNLTRYNYIIEISSPIRYFYTLSGLSNYRYRRTSINVLYTIT